MPLTFKNIERPPTTSRAAWPLLLRFSTRRRVSRRVSR
jgi:hypothetical protein